MGPLVAAAAIGGVQVASGILNYIEGEKAAGRRSDELDRMQDLANKMKLPDFDQSMITPEEYRVLQKYEPALAPYVQESAPQVIQAASSGAVQGRAAEADALAKYRGLADSGDDLQSKVLRARALRDAAVQNRGAQGAIRQSFQQRGQGGSTNELVSALLASQGSNLAGQRAAEDAAMSAYNTKLGALRESASLGADIRNQDVAQEGANANILNAFNTRLARSRQNWENDRAGELNKAQMFNINQNQKVADANVRGRNTSRQDYQDMINNIRQRQFNNQGDINRMQMGMGDRRLGEIDKNLDNRQKLITGIGNGISQGIGGYYYGTKNPRGYDDAAQVAQDEYDDPNSDVSRRQREGGYR